MIQDKPKRPPPPYYDTIAGEPPLPEVIIETDDEAEPEEKNLLELVVEKKAVSYTHLTLPTIPLV